MADSARDNPLRLRLRAARLQPVPAGGAIAAARFLQPDVDGHEACLGPVAFQTLTALVATARRVLLTLNTDDLSMRRIPQYRVNRPVQPIFLTVVSPGRDDLVLFLWQPVSLMTNLRAVFFPGSPAGQGGYHWPTHEIVLHLPSSGSEPETRVAPEDFDLDARLQVQLLNAAARLASDCQWVEIDKSEFRDRVAGQGVPLPPFYLEMLMAALANSCPGGLSLSDWLVGARHAGGVRRQALECRWREEGTNLP